MKGYLQPFSEMSNAVSGPATRDNEELIRSKQLAIAMLRVNMNLMKDQLDEAVANQNFLSAQDIMSNPDNPAVTLKCVRLIVSCPLFRYLHSTHSRMQPYSYQSNPRTLPSLSSMPLF